jgi:hypothetical protein
MLQVVRARRDVPEQGVSAGMVGTVIEIFDGAARTYEVELVDEQGRTIVQATMPEDALEVVSARGSGTV